MEYDPNLTRSMVEPLILQMLHEKRCYGYEIIKQIKERTNGEFEWKEGTIYPCMHRMEGDGLIESLWEIAENGRKRKYYAITKKGKGVLAEKSSEWASFSKAVNAVLFGKGFNPTEA